MVNIGIDMHKKSWRIAALVEGDIDYDTFIDRWYADLNETLAAGKEELGM